MVTIVAVAVVTIVEIVVTIAMIAAVAVMMIPWTLRTAPRTAQGSAAAAAAPQTQAQRLSRAVQLGAATSSAVSLGPLGTQARDAAEAMSQRGTSMGLVGETDLIQSSCLARRLASRRSNKVRGTVMVRLISQS